MRKQTKGDEWVVVEPPRESWFERGFDFASGLIAGYFLFFVLAPIAGLVLGVSLVWAWEKIARNRLPRPR